VVTRTAPTYVRRPAAQPSHARGHRPLLTLWTAWLVVIAGANLATPLYAVYAHSFGFSSLVLTSIFATYAVVLVPALVLFGRLSDRFGRRPVILGGLAVACAGLALFAAASGTAWLYGARALLTAAFIVCIYFLVATGVISAGLLDLRFALAASALAAAAWQLRYARR
jgi:MFS family permease